MKIDDLILVLTNIKANHGNLYVMLDDFYTPASRHVDDVRIHVVDDVPVAVIKD